MSCLWMVASLAPAAPLNMWGSAQPVRTASGLVTSFGAVDGTIAPALYGGLGHAHGDIWAGLGIVGVLGTRGAAYTVDVAPRWFPSDALAICPRIQYIQGNRAVTTGVELHHTLYRGPFGLTSNVGWHPTVGVDGVGGGDVVLLLGPELYLTKSLSIVAEVDLLTPLGAFSESSAVFVPTVSATFDPAGVQSAALGALVPLSAASGPLSFGAWYSWAFGVGGPAATDSE